MRPQYMKRVDRGTINTRTGKEKQRWEIDRDILDKLDELVDWANEQKVNQYITEAKTNPQ